MSPVDNTYGRQVNIDTEARRFWRARRRTSSTIGTPHAASLLLENGSVLLLEDGDRLLTE